MHAMGHSDTGQWFEEEESDEIHAFSPTEAFESNFSSIANRDKRIWMPTRSIDSECRIAQW